MAEDLTDKLALLYKRALERWGAQAQVVMVIEEMAELTKELCKTLRGGYRENMLIEEFADTSIMMEQLSILLNNEIPDFIKKYEDARQRKLVRLEGMLDCAEINALEAGPSAHYICEKCGATAEFTLLAGNGVQELPCKCGGAMKLKEA